MNGLIGLCIGDKEFMYDPTTKQAGVASTISKDGEMVLVPITKAAGMDIKSIREDMHLLVDRFCDDAMEIYKEK